jgi:hypothetical protein
MGNLSIPMDSATVCSSGNYTGDNAAERAIPHGLGRIPLCVIVSAQNSTDPMTFVVGASAKQKAATANRTITTPTSTNFYVGPTGFVAESNNAATVYYWVAF